MAGMRTRGALLAGVACLLFAPAAAPAAGRVEVSYTNGQLRIRCTRAGLDEVLRQVGAATGTQMVLDDSVRGALLTADVEAQPVNLALERVLEGQGVGYAMSLSPDGRSVIRMFVGRAAGATSVASTGRPGGGALIAGRSGRPALPLPASIAQIPGLVPAADDDDDGDAPPGDDSAPVTGISAEAIEGLLKSGVAIPAMAPAGDHPATPGTLPFPMLNSLGPPPTPSPAPSAEQKRGSVVNQ